ncbi:MAG: hypothetical protein M1118_09955 [Chloroflexi bacterium]|nr:hypothetical protein [Chloroflexota bacterium]
MPAHQSESATIQAQLRRTLREYIRWTLYAAIPQGSAPALSLSWLGCATATDADVYSSRPGRGDSRFDERGRPQPRQFVEIEGTAVLMRGPTPVETVTLQASQADSWRAYIQEELRHSEGMLRFERDTVMQLVQRLTPRQQQAIWDIAHRSSAESALHHRCSPAAIKVAIREALDTLLGLLYSSVGRRLI